MTPPATPQAAGGWWPRSLLGRNLLLMAVLIVLGQLVAAVLVRQMIFQPRVAQVADGVARNAGALRAGLQALPPGTAGRVCRGLQPAGRAVGPAGGSGERCAACTAVAHGAAVCSGGVAPPGG